MKKPLNLELLEELVETNRYLCNYGMVPTYIPALSRAGIRSAGIYIIDNDGENFYYGDYNIHFTIQSISKIVTLALALIDNEHNRVFSKVGMEPTEDKFNSILPLELSSAYPPNPMINAGAIVVTSLIDGKTADDKFQRILDYMRTLTGNPNIYLDEETYISERETGNKNRSLAYYLKDAKVMEGDVEYVLDAYFKHCSIAVTAQDLSSIALVLANDGKDLNGQEIMPPEICRTVRVIMSMCGFYDESGRFAVKVGIPGKSGVGGGILGVVPNQMGIGFYGPSLNSKGTSIIGFSVLDQLMKHLNTSIY